MVGRALGCNVLDAMRAARQLRRTRRSSCRGRSRGDHGLFRRRHGGGLGGATATQPTRPSLSSPGSPQARQQPTSSLLGRRSTAASSRSSSRMARSATPPPTRSSSSSPIWSGGRARRFTPCVSTNILQAAVLGPRFARGRAHQPERPRASRLAARLRENRLGAIGTRWRPCCCTTPVIDQIVAFEHSEQLLEDWRDAGVDATCGSPAAASITSAVASPVALWRSTGWRSELLRQASVSRARRSGAAASRGLTRPPTGGWAHLAGVPRPAQMRRVRGYGHSTSVSGAGQPDA